MKKIIYVLVAFLLVTIGITFNDARKVSASEGVNALIFHEGGATEKKSLPIYVYELYGYGVGSAVAKSMTLVGEFTSVDNFAGKGIYTYDANSYTVDQEVTIMGSASTITYAHEYRYYVSDVELSTSNYSSYWVNASTGDIAISYSDSNSYAANVINGSKEEKYSLPLYVYKITINGINYDFELVNSFASKRDFLKNEYTYSYSNNGGVITEYVLLNDYVMFDGNPRNLVIAYQNRAYTNNIVVKYLEKDDTKPALETQVFLTNVDSPISLEDVLKQVKFIDEVDGEIGVDTSNVTSDNYSSNKYKVGKWSITVCASDSSSNKACGEIEIWVEDKTAPVIEGVKEYDSYMSHPITREEIEKKLSVSDNVEGDIQLSMIKDNFTGHEMEKGIKTITYRAMDSEGNITQDYIITINCIDDIKPTIEGDNAYTTLYTVKISLNEIENKLILKDNIDEEITLERVNDEYSSNSSKPGEYKIEYTAKDATGNISEVFIVNVKVEDDIPPVFYTNNLFVGVKKAQTLTHQEIVNIILSMEGIESKGECISLLSLDGYDTESINEVGEYSISYVVLDENGNETSEIKTMILNVLEEEEKVMEKKKEVNKLKQWFINFFNKLKEFFSFEWLKKWFRNLFKKD